MTEKLGRNQHTKTPMRKTRVQYFNPYQIHKATKEYSNVGSLRNVQKFLYLQRTNTPRYSSNNIS